MTGSPPTLRRILGSALAALTVGLGAASLIAGFSDSFPLRLLQGLLVFGAGAVVLGGAVVFVMIRLAGWRDPESEEDFEALVQRAERLAAEDSWGDVEDYAPALDDDDDLFDPANDEDFKALVRAAIDELPLEFHRALEHVAIVVSGGGRRRRAYGLYQGDTVAQDYFHDRIVIFKDTLVRDFGHDPEQLKAQVTRTVRHELAHHLGWDEKGVRGLGL
ncbi:MAG: metallopeptidase family protein [Solirubrobacteraceae bacterium]